jgi:hypothetical protein
MRKLRVSIARFAGILMAVRSRSSALELSSLAQWLRCTRVIPRSGSVHRHVESRTMLALTSGRGWNLALRMAHRPQMLTCQAGLPEIAFAGTANLLRP